MIWQQRTERNSFKMELKLRKFVEMEIHVFSSFSPCYELTPYIAFAKQLNGGDKHA